MTRKAVLVGTIFLAGLWILPFREMVHEPEPDKAPRDSLMTYFNAPAEEHYAPVVPGREFAFPRDHGPHPNFRQEWWYFTGRVESSSGRVFGYQLTFFRFGTEVPEQIPDSAWFSDQTWMAHLAVTDVDGGRFVSQEDFARGALELAGAQVDALTVWVNGWSVRNHHETEGCSGCFTVRLDAAGDEVALDLVLEGRFPPVLQGEKGYSVKSADGQAASYYYSMPGLLTSGMLHLGEQSFSVQGESWMDREWSSTVLASGQSGWDWFALNLSNGYKLVVFQVRESGKPPFLSATLLGDGNRRIPLDPSRIRLTPLRTWTNPGRDASYPVDWEIKGHTDEGEWSISVSPTIDNQELDLSVRYYEGLVAVKGIWNRIPISGWGYMELTGYLIP